MFRFHSTWLVLCALWNGLALAQAAPTDDATRSEASARFRRGVELFQEEAYRAALVEFERAYEIAPDYRLLYNIAQTRLAVQDYLGAAHSYEDYLMQGAEDIPAERLAQVKEALAALRERVGRVRVRVNRDDADVLIDDQKVGRSPLAQALLVNVGRRQITVRGDDGASDTQVIDLAGGDTVEVHLRLAQPRGTVLSTPPAAEPRDTRLSSMKRAAIATWAAGGVLLIGGTVTSLLTVQSADQLKQQLATSGVDRAAVERRRQTTRGLALSSDVLFGAGGALVLTGTLLWLLDRSATEQRASATRVPLRAKVGLASISVHGTF